MFLKIFLILNMATLLFATTQAQTSYIASKKYKNEEFKSYPYYECFAKSSLKHNIPLHVLLGIAKGESNFQPRAVSKANAVGIMQILWPDTAKDLGFKSYSELYKPCKNIDAGAKYFRSLLNRYEQNYYYALAAYNYGPGRIKLGRTPPKGAQWYSSYITDKVIKIVSNKYTYQNSFNYFVFDHYYYATAFKKHLQKKLKHRVNFEIKRLNNSYHVSFNYKTQKEKKSYIKKIFSATGINPAY